MNVLYLSPDLSQDFLGINFEMAFQRTDYVFVLAYVLLRTCLQCTAFMHYGINDLYCIMR